MTLSDRPLADTWFTRDLPVLRAVVRLVDEGEHGGSPYLLGQVVPASGLPKADVVNAARALVSAGYTEALTNHAGDIVRFTAVSAEARHRRGSGPGCSTSWRRGRRRRPPRWNGTAGGPCSTRLGPWATTTARC